MPLHKSYLEPYFGSGAIFFRKPKSRIETINDIDDEVVNLFRVIRDNAEELSKRVSLTPYARSEYLGAWEGVTQDPIEKARLFLLKSWQSHGFRMCSKSGWKIDITGREYDYAVRHWNELPLWIMQTVDRLKQAQIESADAIGLIKKFNRPNVLIYADPPYVLSTRNMKKQYNHEMSDSDHVQLIEVLQQHKGFVMLSGYDNELYNSMLSKWNRCEIKTLAEKAKPRTEVLWTNFEINVQMKF